MPPTMREALVKHERSSRVSLPSMPAIAAQRMTGFGNFWMRQMRWVIVRAWVPGRGGRGD